MRGKKIRCALRQKLYYLLAPKRGRVYFFPEAPHPFTVAYKSLHRIGVHVVHGLPSRLEDATVFLWEDTTYNRVRLQSDPKCRVFNENCIDISKSKVGDLHLDVFGYRLEVDPSTFTGEMVAKSDENGAHSGHILRGPLSKGEQGFIYQRLVRNTSETLNLQAAGPDKAIDFRVPIFRGVQSHMYVKYRAISSRFSNMNDLVEFVEVQSFLSTTEIACINAFCERLGLDYGEVDVIRDSASGPIYLIDANKTPLGPPNGITKAGYREAIRFYMNAFVTFLGSASKATEPSGLVK